MVPAGREMGIGIGLAVVAVLLALGVGVLALSRDDDGQPGRTGAAFDDAELRAAAPWFGAGLLTPPPAILRSQRLPAGMLTISAQEGTTAHRLRLEEFCWAH